MGEKPHFWGIFDVFCPYLKNGSKDFDEIMRLNSPHLIPNTSRKPHVLENSGLGCTVVTRPLFLRLSSFFLSFLVSYNIMTV